MRFKSQFTVIFAAILMLLAATASADVPRLITYQGVLKSSVGAPYSGTKSVKFTIYDNTSTDIWNSGFIIITFSAGSFSVVLGEPPQPPLPTAEWATDTLLRLGIQVDTDPEISPRTRFTTTSFAFHARTADRASHSDTAKYSIYVDTANYADFASKSIYADTAKYTDVALKSIYSDTAAYADNADLLDGINSTDFAPSSHNHGWEDVGSIVRTIDVNDRVIVGATSGLLAFSSFEAHSTGTGSFDVAVFGRNTDTLVGYSMGGLFFKGANSSIWGIPSALGAATDYSGGTAFQTYSSTTATGIYAGHDGDGGIAIRAVTARNNSTAIRSQAGTGFSGYYTGGKGLYVRSDSLYGGEFTTDMLTGSAVAVYGHFDGTGNYDAKGVLGYSVPEEWYGIGGEFQGGFRGVWGRVSSNASNSYYGVYGTVLGSGGGNRYGVSGFATGGSGTKYGVYGQASGAGTNYGVYSVGNCHIQGTLTKSAGAFRIDHPLDPENKYLQHSFVESDEMKNVYDGVVFLDANGSATVTLPDWFDALNENFRYQLTSIGGYAPVFIESEVSNNSFTIAGGTSGMKISWQLTGVRKDAYALANPILLEVPKDAEDIGLYSHPEVYGKPKELGIDYVRENKLLDQHPEKKAALEQMLNSEPAKQGKLKPLPIPKAVMIDAASNN